MRHAKSKLFSLVGRRIILHTPYLGKYTEGRIIEQYGSMRFGCELLCMGKVVAFAGFHRASFHLPPLSAAEREPEWLNDDYDGFVYKDNPAFINKFARY